MALKGNDYFGIKSISDPLPRAIPHKVSSRRPTFVVVPDVCRLGCDHRREPRGTSKQLYPKQLYPFEGFTFDARPVLLLVVRPTFWSKLGGDLTAPSHRRLQNRFGPACVQRAARLALSVPICEWMYVKYVVPDHRPIFMMVESIAPCSLSAIAPDARSEWVPIRRIS
jgi:hypothetical protein